MSEYIFTSLTDRPQIRVFGTLSVSHSGLVHVNFRSNRVVALLGYLASHPRPQLREDLAQQLWPEAEPAVARHNLRQNLIYLREALGPFADTVLEASRSHLGLIPDSYDSDFQILEATGRHQEFETKRQLCEEARRVYTGPFLQSINDEWALAVRSRISSLYVHAMLFLADAVLQESPVKALDYAESAIAEAPFMGAPRVRKIRALVLLGDQPAAKAEYEAYRDLLNRELGSEPDREVLDALGEEPFIFNLISRPGDAASPFEVLSRAGRPQQAVKLAVNMVPLWIETGVFTPGIQTLQETMDGNESRISTDAMVAAKLSLAELMSLQGNFADMNKLMLETEQSVPLMSPETKAKWLILRTRQKFWENDIPGALKLSKAAIRCAQTCQENELLLDSIGVATRAAVYSGDYNLAAKGIRHSIALGKQLGNKTAIVTAMLEQSELHETLGRPDLAEECARKAIQLSKGIVSPRMVSNRLQAARVLEGFGRVNEAEVTYFQSLQDFRSFETGFGRQLALTYLGDLLSAKNRSGEAAAFHAEALALRRKHSHKLGIATSLRGLGKALYDIGELNGAREALAESAQLYLELSSTPGYASSQLALSKVEAMSGNRILAISLATQARNLLAKMDDSEKRAIGPSGLTAIQEADALIASWR
ncbi:MAG TPA: BTAD domain-containing putative transcriptional regulator [Fimbriimonadaceae bacterium]|jgi:DNA-binding SARP family transcriptional activator